MAGRAGTEADGDLSVHSGTGINAGGEYWVFAIDRETFAIGSFNKIYRGSYTGGTETDWATDIFMDNDGNYFVSGFCASCDPGKVQWEAYLLNLDPADGSVNWSGIYG